MIRADFLASYGGNMWPETWCLRPRFQAPSATLPIGAEPRPWLASEDPYYRPVGDGSCPCTCCTYARQITGLRNHCVIRAYKT
jgi:hypothetical protein